MSDQIQRPTCAVKGLLHGDRAMCGRVINAEFCGNSDPCEHKVDHNAFEEKKLAGIGDESLLRDQIAIAYMQSCVAGNAYFETFEGVSEEAYKMADAMLRERSK